MKLGKLLKRIDDETLIQVVDDQTHKATSPEYVTDFSWRQGLMGRKVAKIEVRESFCFSEEYKRTSYPYYD